MDKDGVTVKILAVMDADDRLALKQKMEDTAMASGYKEYLACVFLMMSDDGWYKPLKTKLEKNFLMQRPFWRPRC